MPDRDSELSQGRDAVVARAPTGAPEATIAPSAVLASAIGNRATARLARSLAQNGSSGRRRSPEAQILAGALGLLPATHPTAGPLLARALAEVERDPGTLSRAPAGPSASGGTCACGGTILPGGECSKCMAQRLARQGMPNAEIQRMVLARTALAEKQTLMRKRSFMGCLNNNLSSMGLPWAVIATLGAVCGVLGGIAGLAGGPAAPATAPSGMAIAAAVCIAFVTGLSVGTILAVIHGCWSDTEFLSRGASTASNDVPTDAGDAEAAMA